MNNSSALQPVLLPPMRFQPEQRGVETSGEGVAVRFAAGALAHLCLVLAALVLWDLFLTGHKAARAEVGPRNALLSFGADALRIDRLTHPRAGSPASLREET